MNAETTRIRNLFLDIGGVVLTNGWDRGARRRAAERFGLEAEEVDERHHLIFGAYEEGRVTLDQYLDRVVFYRERSFSRDDFRLFMLAQSVPLPGMLDLLAGLKSRHGLRMVAVNNEGRELSEHRIRTFRLGELIDTFVSSCFVHARKPDPEIFRIALDVSQAVPAETAYLEDRAMFVEIAQGFGIRAIRHRDLASTREELSKIGLAA